MLTSRSLTCRSTKTLTLHPAAPPCVLQQGAVTFRTAAVYRDDSKVTEGGNEAREQRERERESLCRKGGAHRNVRLT